jgi:hypothetical protein
MRWLARVQSCADGAAAERLVHTITGVPVRSALLGAQWQRPHPEDAPTVIGSVETAWWDASSVDVLAVLAFNDTAQARLVDRAMRPWRRGMPPTRFGCALRALTRETATGWVVAVPTLTLDLVSYAGADGMVLRSLDDTDVPAPAGASADR